MIDLNLIAIVCDLSGPFTVVFPKNKTINSSHVTHFIRFYWSYNIIGKAAKSGKIKSNPGRVITMQMRLEPCLNMHMLALEKKLLS